MAMHKKALIGSQRGIKLGMCKKSKRKRDICNPEIEVRGV